MLDTFASREVLSNATLQVTDQLRAASVDLARFLVRSTVSAENRSLLEVAVAQLSVQLASLQIASNEPGFDLQTHRDLVKAAQGSVARTAEFLQSELNGEVGDLRDGHAQPAGN